MDAKMKEIKLGGHKRSRKSMQLLEYDSIAQRINNSPHPPPQNKLNSASGAFSHDKVSACSECGKEFCSWKALFGHMRCHPEREWRGIHPPQVNSVNSAVDEDAREREEERDLAHCLVMLSSVKRRSNRNSDINSNRIQDAHEDEDHSSWKAIEDYSCEVDTSVEDKWQWPRFECGTCKKVFRSHQALGGHRASHRRVKGCFAKTNSLLCASIPDLQEYLPPPPLQQEVKELDLLADLNWSMALPSHDQAESIDEPMTKEPAPPVSFEDELDLRLSNTCEHEREISTFLALGIGNDINKKKNEQLQSQKKKINEWSLGGLRPISLLPDLSLDINYSTTVFSSI